LPEPVVDAPQDAIDDITLPLMMALERLSPLERAAFLLHDVFDRPFSEIAGMLDRSEAACRQLAARGRRGVRQQRPARPAPPAPPENHARLLDAFGEAVASGDISRLAALLREDAIAISDGGGRKAAALNPIIGADKIARLFIGLAGKNAGHDLRVVPAMINGSIGALLYMDGELDHTFSMAIDGDKIAAIYLVRNPDKLRHVPPTGAADGRRLI
jgi:RNA polymerase sigma-70 factor (ECF subfamily)